jgi:hypothetical protein
MKRVIPVVLALGFAGCAHHTSMTNQQLTRSALGVGAAVLITSAIVYAEYRSSPPELPTTSAALPPK